MTTANRSEAQLLADVRQALGREPDLTLWRNNTGGVETTGRGGRDRLVRYGLCRGSADLVGILGPHGRLLALECKTATGRTTPEQDLFLDLVRSRGGFAAVVRSVEDARAAIDRARQGAHA